MAESKHTPGPWTATPVRTATRHDFPDTGATRVYVCEVTDGTSRLEAHVSTVLSESIAAANARLIAAAPDLLAACEALHSILLQFTQYQGSEWYQKTKAAIAKARGGGANALPLPERE